METKSGTTPHKLKSEITAISLLLILCVCMIITGIVLIIPTNDIENTENNYHISICGILSHDCVCTFNVSTNQNKTKKKETYTEKYKHNFRIFVFSRFRIKKNQISRIRNSISIKLTKVIKTNTNRTMKKQALFMA